MAEIGIMLEGQEDLTWERFFRLAEAVETLGFGSLLYIAKMAEAIVNIS